MKFIFFKLKLAYQYFQIMKSGTTLFVLSCSGLWKSMSIPSSNNYITKKIPILLLFGMSILQNNFNNIPKLQQKFRVEKSI